MTEPKESPETDPINRPKCWPWAHEWDGWATRVSWSKFHVRWCHRCGAGQERMVYRWNSRSDAEKGLL